MERNPVALTIAGSDSGGGAGIQADLKTFAALGVYGCSVLTLITAQNTQAVSAVHMLPPLLIRQQLEAVASDFEIRALKTGALGSASIIRSLAEDLRRRQPLKLVIDPVMISKHGHRLLDDDAVAILRDELFPLALLVTPNLHEAAALVGMSEIRDRNGMLAAANAIAAYGCRAVVIKGGHASGDAADLLWYQGQASWLQSPRIDSPHTHGTGCTFSAAITANLVLEMELYDAVAAAKEYISGAIAAAQLFGTGVNPVNHFWRVFPRFGASRPGSR